MSPKFCLLIAVFAFAFLLPNLRAEDSAFALPTGEPLATLTLPEGQSMSAVSVAVSKALIQAEWENLGWEGNVTTATVKKSRIAIKVFAVAAASEIKLYATYTSESNIAEEKCRQIALRGLRSLEEVIAEKLNLLFRKGKGDTTVDRAVTS